MAQKTVWTCPACGAALAVRLLGKSKTKRLATMIETFGESAFQTFALGDVGEAGEIVREEPVRAATIQSEVWVPALTALITGIVITIIMAGIAQASGWSWLVPAIIGSTAFVICWFACMGDQRNLLRKTMKWKSKDATEEEQAGSVEHNIRIEARTGKHTTKFYHFENTNPNDLKIVADRVCRNGGRITTNGAGIPRLRYEPLRDRLVESGWLFWESTREVRATRVGMVAFEQLLQELK